MSEKPEQQTEKSAPILKAFYPLIGDWNMVSTHPMFPSEVHGRATIEWLDEGYLLLMRTSYENPGPPSGIMVIGGDDSLDTCCMLYSDPRGVSRIYRVSLEGGVWRMWRDAPGFFQRFTGAFSKDGNNISALWELSRDGSTWKDDLKLAYTKVRRE